MNVSKASMRLYAVTDRAWLGESTLAAQVAAAIRGGATFIQLREKNQPDAAFTAQAIELGAICKANGVPFVVNDRLDIALAANADGVHIGQEDIHAGHARTLLGADKILGVSAHTVEEALLAVQNGADYLGVGAMFPTSTKPDADVVSLATLRAIRAAVSIPIVVIGGINTSNLLSLRGGGADGVAVVSALFAEADTCVAAQTLCTLVDQMLAPIPHV